MSGKCVGRPEPQFHHVEVVERPKTARRPYKSALITAYVFHPEETRVVPPADSAGTVYNVCAGIGLSFPSRVKLKRQASDLFFYDGARKPPRRIWPPVEK